MSPVLWEPYTRSDRIRITETSCCGAYEWACQGGQFLILRFAGPGYEETARGLYRQAREAWEDLVHAHASAICLSKQKGCVAKSAKGARRDSEFSHPRSNCRP